MSWWFLECMCTMLQMWSWKGMENAAKKTGQDIKR